MRYGDRSGGGATNRNNHNRSIPLAQWLVHLPADLQFVSLQKDLNEADAKTLAANPSILNIGHELKDFADTAALVKSLDLVISVCTSVAHLSGALGQKTWILLRAAADWR